MDMDFKGQDLYIDFQCAEYFMMGGAGVWVTVETSEGGDSTPGARKPSLFKAGKFSRVNDAVL